MLRTSLRSWSNGLIVAAMTMPLCRTTSRATNAMRNTLARLSLREKPRSGHKTGRTTSPSSSVTGLPNAVRCSTTACAMVDFPEHGSPVNHIQTPFKCRVRSLSALHLVTQSSKRHICVSKLCCILAHRLHHHRESDAFYDRASRNLLR